jgi:hypothetical protein
VVDVLPAIAERRKNKSVSAVPSIGFRVELVRHRAASPVVDKRIRWLKLLKVNYNMGLSNDDDDHACLVFFLKTDCDGNVC